MPDYSSISPKPAVKSKTVWLNVLATVAGLVVSLGNTDVVQENPEWAAIAGTAVAVANIVLRFVTKEPLKVK